MNRLFVAVSISMLFVLTGNAFAAQKKKTISTGPTLEETIEYIISKTNDIPLGAGKSSDGSGTQVRFIQKVIIAKGFLQCSTNQYNNNSELVVTNDLTVPIAGLETGTTKLCINNFFESEGFDCALIVSSNKKIAGHSDMKKINEVSNYRPGGMNIYIPSGNNSGERLVKALNRLIQLSKEKELF
jgi:hypothetical protein